MRAGILVLTGSFITGLGLFACGSPTDRGPDRYNFGIVDGANQSSAAGAPSLSKPITSQLTRDANGKFATQVLDFLLPVKAYAQGSLPLSGEPVAGAIVCGRVAPIDEPQVVPLCAFTLADGKAANSVKPGTKAGTFNILFTAQVESQEPVEDSTSVTVLAGPMASHRFIDRGFVCHTTFPADAVKDQYGNSVSYRMLTTGPAAHVVSDVLGSEGARTFVADTDTSSPDGQGQPVTVEVATGPIAVGEITQTSTSLNCVTIWFAH